MGIGALRRHYVQPEPVKTPAPEIKPVVAKPEPEPEPEQVGKKIKKRKE